VSAEAADGAEAVRLAAREEIDLAILDVSMPRMTGLQAARELHRRRPGLPIVILTMHESEQYLHEALRAGAAAYVVKKVADRDLIEACRAALHGAPFRYPGESNRAIDEAVRRAREGAEPREVLTPRETEVLKLVAEGHANRQIAETLVISEKTVDRHRTNIFEKLGLHDRVELVRYAIRNGLVEP
jgi:DNA-binding NarL/FixJ family response regulator